MHRSFLTLLCGAVMAVGAGQVALAVDGPPVDQPAPVDRSTVVQPAPSDRTTIVQPGGQTTIVQGEDRVAVRSNGMAVQHVSTVNRLPSGSVAAIENAFPGGTIVGVDRTMTRDGWNVKVSDPQGRLHQVKVSNDGQIVTQKDLRKESDRVAKLPENVRASLMQRYPNAVIYDSETTVEDGKKAYEVEILNNGQRLDVKLHHRTGEILEVESDADDVSHDPGAWQPSSGTTK